LAAPAVADEIIMIETWRSHNASLGLTQLETSLCHYFYVVSLGPGCIEPPRLSGAESVLAVVLTLRSHNVTLPYQRCGTVNSFLNQLLFLPSNQPLQTMQVLQDLLFAVCCLLEEKTD
jgi:hypothetical protein